MPSCASTSDWRPTSVTRTALGSEARTRTPTACCASTSPRAPTSATTAPATSPPSLLPSTADPARPSVGEPPQRPSMTSYTPANTAALRRPLEPGLAAVVGVMDQAWGGVALGDGHVQGVQDQLGGQVLSHRPADDPPGERVEDHGEVQPALTGALLGDV